MVDTINYMTLLRWFWDEGPYLPGYKSEYGSVFLAIVDSIDRNSWRETAIDFDRIINKVKCSKKMYYESLKWLSRQQNLLTYTPGRNDYAPARFSLGDTLKIEVQKCTSISSSASPLLNDLIEAEVQKCTSTDTSTGTSSAPIKDIIYKVINNNARLSNDASILDEEKAPSFDSFWEAYGKKRGKANAQKEWNKLTRKQHQQAIDGIVQYIRVQPDPQFRKDPERYLKHRTWEDDFTLPASPQPQTTSSLSAHSPKPVSISR